MTHSWRLLVFPLLLALTACDKSPSSTATTPPSSITLLNVSYDPTREFYQAYNTLFQTYWRTTTGQTVTVQQSHGGSGKQALAIIHGLQADVTTLALAGDIDVLNQDQPLINPQWQQSLPDNSTPYTSTIVFLVRKGNPKHIRDWDDLVRDDIAVITPNPKTSGGARWNFLAAWAYAKQKNHGSDAAAERFVRDLYQRVPVLDSGARGATMTFTQRQIGDVLLAWENEAYLALNVAGDDFEIVTPSLSILCEPPVAVIDSVVDKKGTRQVAEAYLKYLYSEAAQRLIAQNFYRPIHPTVQAEFNNQFPPLTLVTIDEAFGGWAKAQKTFFDDGGVFDRLYAAKAS
ncbi:MAG: sulfate ABC transporter substrate-binding protein [Neisseriaceae bacterium]|nr:sulfate ABC transporter substrate-binding protein [Neisseriaceae bacterium]